MTTEEFQQIINANLRIISSDGTFKMKVAEEGMLWKDKANGTEKEAIGNSIEIEGLDSYVLRIENDYENKVIKLVIEDQINRYDLRFVRPYLDSNNKNVLYAEGEKGMLAKGPELRLEIIPDHQQPQATWVLDIDVFKGKKNLFKDRISLANSEGNRLQHFLSDKFT